MEMDLIKCSYEMGVDTRRQKLGYNNGKANDVNGFIGIGMNMKGIYENGLD